MRLLIDNLDGKGPTDYSEAMCAEGPTALVRKLNAPSRFTTTLLLSDSSRPVPARRGRVVVSADDSTVLFTGYLPTEPEELCIGTGMTGRDCVFHLVAESDEWLLDQQGVMNAGSGAFDVDASALLQVLTERTDPERWTVSAAGTVRRLGLFLPEPEKVWSQQAAAIARGSYAAYRVVGGSVSLLPAGSAVHVVPDEEGVSAPGALRLRSDKALVNDITVSGEREPGAYVTEVFQGDGTTAEFVLSAVPFRPTGRTAVPLINDSFAGDGSLDTAVWTLSDPGAHFQLGATGLGLRGGTGLDGQTTLSLQDAVELGGTVTLEMSGVVLNATSDGVLCGVYDGPIRRGNCVAGFDVRQSGGSTTVGALVSGSTAGTVATLLSGHTYALRLRLICAEMHRVRQTFTTMVDGAVQSFGGGAVPASLHAVLELVDLGLASNTPATVLFDGVIPDAAAVATFVPLNSVQLFGSVSSVRVARGGPALVSTTTATGTRSTRRLGAAGDGTDAELTGERLVFFAGRVPAAGEALSVVYRTTQRAVARVQDAQSVTAEAASGLPGAARELVHAQEPVARSSADCEAAGMALLSAATKRSAAVRGEYLVENPDDLWPGDVLDVVWNGQTLPVMVRSVEVNDLLALPELLRYRAALANEWAEPLGMQVARGLAADVASPVAVGAGANALPASLSGLTVVQVSGSAIQLDMGFAAPAGGGFEVRRRDGEFGPGDDPDLVVRSPVRGFSIPRTGEAERLFVRMYDASPTPRYSAVSAAVYTHVPVG